MSGRYVARVREPLPPRYLPHERNAGRETGLSNAVSLMSNTFRGEDSNLVARHTSVPIAPRLVGSPTNPRDLASKTALRPKTLPLPIAWDLYACCTTCGEAPSQPPPVQQSTPSSASPCECLFCAPSSSPGEQPRATASLNQNTALLVRAAPPGVQRHLLRCGSPYGFGVVWSYHRPSISRFAPAAMCAHRNAVMQSGRPQFRGSYWPPAAPRLTT